MKTRSTAACIALLASFCWGCAFWNLAETNGTFEDSLRTYSKLVRWGEIERAAIFVEDPSRAEFLAMREDMEDIRFTDFEVGAPRFGEGGSYARVTVTYNCYRVSSLVEQTIREEQVWRRDGMRSWVVDPDLEAFQKVLEDGKS